MRIAMESVTREQRAEFEQLAIAHFRELDPNFVPTEDWKRNYFERIQATPRFRLRWIVADGKRAGFILFGLEEHRFLTRTSGWIYELYVCPELRQQGIAQSSARQAIEELKAQTPKIQLEIAVGNRGGMALWRSLGFHKATERWVLTEDLK